MSAPANDRQAIVHLVDDPKAGGVQRLLQSLDAFALAEDGWAQKTVLLQRARPIFVRFGAHTVVSHCAAGWRNFALPLSLRACNPGARFVHVEHTYAGGFECLEVSNVGRFRHMLRLWYGLHDQVVAVSKAQRDWMIATGLAPETKIAVANPLIDLSAFRALPPPRLSRPLQVGFVGRLHQAKGPDILIDAMRLGVSNMVSLHLFGDGPMRAELEGRAKGVANVIFHGHACPHDAMRQIDVLAVPSRRETFGIACLEARAAARPVLAASVDGLDDQVRSCGRIVKENVPHAWASVLGELVPDNLEKMSLQSRIHAEGVEQASLKAWRSVLQV